MKVALIGYGYWGPNLAKNLNLIPDIEFAGICDTDEKKLDRARNLYGDSVTYVDDYHLYLEDKSIEAVVIATQTDVSYKIAMDSLASGKHIFIEKPIASTTERAKNIMNLAKEKHLIVHCDHIMIYHPAIRYIKNMIERGELGDLLYIDISRVNLGPLRKDVNALLDLAVHDLAIIDYLAEGQKCTKVSAMGQTCFGKQETHTYLSLKYESFVAMIKSSWISPIKERKTVIAGTKKMVIFDDVINDKLAVYDRGFNIQMAEEYGTYEYNVRSGDIFYPHLPVEDALRNSIYHFLECILEGRESLSGPSHAYKVMEILENGISQL